MKGNSNLRLLRYGKKLTRLISIINIDYLIQTKKDFQEAGIILNNINIGGGLGISYKGEDQLIPSDVLKEVIDRLALTDTNLLVEPGRSIV